MPVNFKDTVGYKADPKEIVLYKKARPRSVIFGSMLSNVNKKGNRTIHDIPNMLYPQIKPKMVGEVRLMSTGFGNTEDKALKRCHIKPKRHLTSADLAKQAKNVHDDTQYIARLDGKLVDSKGFVHTFVNGEEPNVKVRNVKSKKKNARKRYHREHNVKLAKAPNTYAMAWLVPNDVKILKDKELMGLVDIEAEKLRKQAEERRRTALFNSKWAKEIAKARVREPYVEKSDIEKAVELRKFYNSRPCKNKVILATLKKYVGLTDAEILEKAEKSTNLFCKTSVA